MIKKGMIFTFLKVSFLLFICAITLYPFLHMIAVSFSANLPVMQGKVGLIPIGFNISAYKEVFQNKMLFTAYKNTIIYVVGRTLIGLLVTSCGAYALTKKHMLFHRFFSLMVVFTMFFSGGMIPTYLVMQKLNLIDTRWGVILINCVSVWYLLLMRTFFSSIPKDLEDSGKIDGLQDIGILWYIILPLSKAAIATIGLFYAVAMWNSFFNPFIYLNSPEKYPLQVILRQIVIANDMKAIEYAGEDAAAMPESIKYATIMVSTIPIILVYPFIQKYFVKGVMIGSVKG
ncbi:MAG TPA: carbohydrate ABC transporter permease [Clostridiaceae bacterium]|nr:carbohydrate ABC transporter permease [Clostridiaceae bacterium]